LLALLLAEREVIGALRTSVPLMLLDDVMSELDRPHRGALVELLARSGGQALITTTELEHIPGVLARGVARIAVADGEITEDITVGTAGG